MITSPLLDFPWLSHGFGLRNSVPPPGLTTAKQIHSARILDACGRQDQQIGEGDAIISAEPGVAVGIRTADCVPILMVDPETRFVAAVHAGWRGTAANISAATVELLRSRGCDPGNLCVAIGPSIGSCCYEVSADVARQFDQWQNGGPDSPHPKLDLPAINEKQLIETGIHRIWKSGECTYCNPRRFFSFRRDKEQAGRMLSFVSRLA